MLYYLTGKREKERKRRKEESVTDNNETKKERERRKGKQREKKREKLCMPKTRRKNICWVGGRETVSDNNERIRDK